MALFLSHFRESATCEQLMNGTTLSPHSPVNPAASKADQVANGEEDSEKTGESDAQTKENKQVGLFLLHPDL